MAKDTEVKLIKMVRDAETNEAPYEADVHPGEVENMQAFGWVVAK